MKKKLYIIFVLLLMVIVTAALTGCSQPRTVTLTDTTDQIQGLEDYKPSGALASAFEKDVTYEVRNISWNGDTGIAEVIITTPDLAKIISDSIETAIHAQDSEDYDTLLQAVKEDIHQILTSEEFPTSVTAIEMEAKKNDNGYLLISNEEFRKIISGDPEKIYIQILLEGFNNGTIH